MALDLTALMLATAYPAYRWFDFFVANPEWTLLIGFVLSFSYFVTLNSRLGNGQTCGKWLLGVRVVDIQGEPISLERSALRFLVLATPFFGEKVGIPCSGSLCSVTTLLDWIFGFWEAAIFYLFLFNRRTRQSLHDLAASTYVIRTNRWPAKQAQPSPEGSQAPSFIAANPRVTTQTLWSGHLKILFAGLLGCLAIGVVLSVSLGLSILEKTGLSGLVQISQAVQRSGKARSVGVNLTISKTNGSASQRQLVVSFAPTHISDDKAGQAAQIAAIVLGASPKDMEIDSLAIVILQSADFGFFHYTANRTFRHSLEEWKNIVLPTGARQPDST